MFITVIVSLYTSRITLQYLGVTDYGISNVVGGVISMFGFITTTMSNASTRFFSYSLGQNDKKELEDTFKTTVTIYLVLIAIIFIIAETVGLWFVWCKLNIPSDRHDAAMIVYQIALLTLYSGLLRIPYNSAIIAHERMDFYAYISIAETVLKLLIVYLLTLTSLDRMIFYNWMFLGVSAIVTICYILYCKKKFTECVFSILIDRTRFKSIFAFAGWNFTSNMGDVAMDQGINILINLYFGPTVNAARAIAYQIKNQVANFSWNFLMAATPQITKLYAAGRKDDMYRLVLQSSKVSFYLMLLLSVPMYIGIDLLLNLWLMEVPMWTTILCKLAIVNLVISAWGGTLQNAIQATGIVKRFVLLLTIGKVMAFMLTLIAFKYDFATVEYSIYFTILYAFFSLFVQCYEVKKILSVDIIFYLKDIVFRSILVITMIIAFYYSLIAVININNAYIQEISLMFTSFVCACFASYYIGFNSEEKKSILRYIRRRLYRH